jgi:hypothetical protein
MAEQFDAIFKKAATTNTVDAKLYKNHNQKTKISLIFWEYNRNDSDEARHQFYNTLEIPRIRIKLFKAI